MSNHDLLSKMVRGVHARLIPSVSDSSKEQRATSALLATFRVVPGFAQAMLEEADAPVSKTARVDCYTEIVLANKASNKKSRPDGLITVERGSKSWSALVEAKVGNTELNREQIEEYLDLAREVGADALITISNQFSALPTHHPVAISKQKTKAIPVFHFSWLGLMSKAVLLSENKEISDPEQAFILKELIRFLESDASGVTAFNRMSTEWRDICAEIQQGQQPKKSDARLEEVVSDWHELSRYLAIELSVAVGKSVTIHMPRKQAKDPGVRLREDVDDLVKNQSLVVEFVVPNAAACIVMAADLLRRTVNLSMKLDPPGDKSRPTAAVNWLTRQLKDTKDSELLVRVHWPGRMPATVAPLIVAKEEPKSVVPETASDLPSSLEIVKVLDLGGRFKQTTKFVEECRGALMSFYAEIGQNLNSWRPKPPKVRQRDDGVGRDEEDSGHGDGIASPDREEGLIAALLPPPLDDREH